MHVPGGGGGSPVGYGVGGTRVAVAVGVGVGVIAGTKVFEPVVAFGTGVRVGITLVPLAFVTDGGRVAVLVCGKEPPIAADDPVGDEVGVVSTK